MPKKPTDYSKLVIYKIQHVDNPELLYVGSTTDFTKRKNGHKSRCSNHNPIGNKYNYKLYQMMMDNGGWSMFNMVVIKEFPCENKRQAEAEEDKLIREMKSNMNSNRAFITPEEIIERQKQYNLEHRDENIEYKKQYRLENKDKIKQYNLENKERSKQWRLDNKDKLAERRKQWRLDNNDKLAENKKQYALKHKDKIVEYKKQYALKHKDKIKQWRLDNKDKIAEHNKQLYNQNKEQIAERRKQKITCECGCVIRKDTLARHKRSKTHQDLMNSNDDDIINKI